MQRDSEAVRDERQRDQHEQRKRGATRPRRRGRELARRQRARDETERERGEQRPQRRAGFLIAEHEIADRDRGTDRAEQAPREQRDDRCNEDIEQRPRRDPAAGALSAPGRRATGIRSEDAASSSRDRNCPAIRSPAATRRRCDAHAGREIDRGVRHSTPVAPGSGRASPAGSRRCAPKKRIQRIGAFERERRRDIEPPAAQHLAADAIRANQPSPEKSSHISRSSVSRFFSSARPRDRSSIVNVAPSPSTNAGNARQASVDIRLAGIDLQCARCRRHAQRRSRFVAPDLLLRPRRVGHARDDFRERRGRARFERVVSPGAPARATAVGIETAGHSSRERSGSNPAGSAGPIFLHAPVPKRRRGSRSSASPEYRP